MRILLVDDETLALERLETLLVDVPDVEVVGVARDGEEAAEQIAALRPDLVLLDIQMPNRDGLCLARALKARPDAQVVFVTAYDQFALAAFDVDAIDYLLKPVEPARLKLAVDRARRLRVVGAPEPTFESAEPEVVNEPYSAPFWVRRPRGLVRVEIDSVAWIEAARDYVLLHTPNRSHMYRSTMDALTPRLDPASMLRVSRSAFVRREAVVRVRRRRRGVLVLELSDGAEVPVGNTYTHAVSREFLQVYDDVD
ncbi:LytTR family DNA-binding domain-containing protein [Phenylobacterium sp. Root700]|uniref:LytR/AlgR family response regulator transcription factor n=1 Tax=Phenylobacterium sp. Root700 TaxID=1736591 RepID=UPI0006F5BE23|nr:LytTR family DNA-binding domain-containing protein [Phenylobacterium sp. Root700]KRB46749.1 hypothetical protein ASE02_19995 [Phenylobacterium sp. Root700]